eukprot:6270709-Amphidinium_carterae.1
MMSWGLYSSFAAGSLPHCNQLSWFGWFGGRITEGNVTDGRTQQNSLLLNVKRVTASREGGYAGRGAVADMADEAAKTARACSAIVCFCVSGF